MFEQEITELHLEGTTPYIEFDIADPESGEGFQPQTLTLTLWDAKTGSIINNRDGVDVLSSVNAQGHVQFWLTPQDMVVHDQTKTTEVRCALFAWTWQGGERNDALEVKFTIFNHQKR